MSLWTKAQQLPAAALQQVRAIYGEHFPIEVRHFLAPWLELNIWRNVEVTGPERDALDIQMFKSFIQEMQDRGNALVGPDFFLNKVKLNDTACLFAEKYIDNPRELFDIMRQCMRTEYGFLEQNGIHCPTPMPPCPGNAKPELANSISNLRKRTDETLKNLRELESRQEDYALSYHEGTKINAQMQHLANQVQSPQIADLLNKMRLSKEKQDQTLQDQVLALLDMRMSLIDKLKDNISVLANIQSKVLDDELIRWKREQQLSGNGSTYISNLDHIQDWCESLAEIIWMNRQQIKELEVLKQKVRLEPAGMVDFLPALNSRITQLLSSLVTSTFIIEKQPPQVMKTNTRFLSTVRLLVGCKLNVHMSSPQVEVSIISEAQANSLLQNDRHTRPADTRSTRNDVSGEILNNTGRMDYGQSSRHLSVQFRNMQLKKIKRAEKKGTESVMDEKFSLLFQTQFSVAGGELMFQVWTLSLPVVVIVHGNQEPHAWATVTWDNAFAEPGRTPFAVPEKVPWSQVAEALNCKFQSVTGRGLTEDNLKFLAEKAFRVTTGSHFDNHLLSWSLFCKETLPDRTFTFWEWFYAVMKITKEHLKGPWTDGSIIGFVQKQRAEEMLSSCPQGSFLLRFSDSEPGGVVIAWVGDQNQIYMLHPFTSKDFAIRSLADRLTDQHHLLYLYPNVSKDSVFGKYYSPAVTDNSKNGYVKPELRTHVPGHTLYGSPGTPQPNTQPLSPEPAPRYGELDFMPAEFYSAEMETLGIVDFAHMDDTPSNVACLRTLLNAAEEDCIDA